MSEVVLDRLWVHLANDPDTYLRFYTTGRGDSRSVGGSVRAYANGRNRIITTASTSRSLPATLRMVSDDDLDLLESWRGLELMVRDHRGRLMFGTFFDIEVTDYKDRSGYDVAVSFVESTFEVAV